MRRVIGWAMLAVPCAAVILWITVDASVTYGAWWAGPLILAGAALLIGWMVAAIVWVLGP